MRVHRLELTAFGPFADHVAVDLDDVGRDGLFLLWGPTGAGKTTLLDAVVYALYGTVPGARGEEKRLRSDHATAEVRTEVQCEVTLSGERLQVTRRPEQQRPKRRGTGWTTEQARLTVQRWTADGWEPVSTRIDEGSEHLRTRLGLSAEQFCQVVLLPQGDFARFLRAEPEDRGRLLRTLFDVGRFARVEDWLAAQRTEARERLDEVRMRASTLLARVAQVADVDVPEELAPELVGAAPHAHAGAWVKRVRAEVAERLRSREAAAEAAAQEVTRVDAVLAAARVEDQRHTRRDRARAELTRLQAEAAELVPLR
ncbi:MAG: putative ATP-dependent dsDNA exonuclease, partial [Modestobacter sp.]|nr:putative ATP-dependent dsDNA exonuclease [Modestobacter sp.]